MAPHSSTLTWKFPWMEEPGRLQSMGSLGVRQDQSRKLTHNHKGFSVVNETEVDVFLEFPCFLYDPANVGNLISGSSAFSKRSLKHLEVLSSLMLRPSLEDFEHYLTSMVDECSCPVV